MMKFKKNDKNKKIEKKGRNVKKEKKLSPSVFIYNQ